jgi:predicted nucleotidyltransferase
MQNDLTPVKQELDALVKIIVETVPVEQIYLFGSYAYGTPHKDSDFDLYVVLKDDAPMRDFEAMDAIGIATFEVRKRAIDFLVHKKVKFLDRAAGFATIEKEVAKEGVKIYG